MSARALFQRVCTALTDADVSVDRERSAFELTSSRRVRIALRCVPATAAMDATEAMLMESAIHCLVRDELKTEVDWDESELHVHVYWVADHDAAEETDAENPYAEPLMPWIASNFHSLCTHVLQGATMALQEAYSRMIWQYPWRFRDTMAHRARTLVQHHVRLMMESGVSPKSLANACDDLLPPCEVLLPEYDRTVVYAWVAERMGRVPLTRLEFYTAVYGCSLDNTTPPALVLLHSRLFATPRR